MSNTPEVSSRKGASASNLQIVVFKLGREEYALSIDQIKEVVITPNITKMPRTPGFVKGVANVRGNIIAVLDLEEKFNIQKNEKSGNDGNNFTLVIESEEYKTGVLVREVPNTLSIPSDAIEESVFTGTGETESDQNYISGIVKLGKRLIIMIDIFKVINDQDTQQLFKKHAISV